MDELISGIKYKDELEDVIDKIIYNAFGLTEEEILEIEKFIGREREKNVNGLY